IMILGLSAANAVITMCKKTVIDQCPKTRPWAASTVSDGSFGSSTYGSGYNDATWQVRVSIAPTGTIEGIARCTTSGSDPSTPSSGGKICWCRMTGQDGNNACLGGYCVFLFAASSASHCANDCANACAYCVQNGGHLLCSRAAVLSLP
ncbi:MAG: hypothetical protein LBD94_01050, partial [Rickettsiales bacterium]|nr:hypothetical protein [Rickettsiales bacterium]